MKLFLAITLGVWAGTSLTVFVSFRMVASLLGL